MSTSGTRAGEALPGTRLLLGLVIGMGVLIAAGVVVVVVTLVSRGLGAGGASRPAASAVAARVLLGEPAGARIVSVTAAGDRLALLISGGGVPDRVVLLDAQAGTPVATVGLGAAPSLPPR